MDFTTETQSKDFTCASITLQCPLPVQEGDECSSGMADSLNQTLVENARNNFTKTCKEMQEQEKSAEEIQTAFLGWVKGYEFGVRKGRSAIIDPVEREAWALAKERVVDKLKSMGKKLSEIDADTMNGFIQNALEKFPQFREEAQKIIDQKNALAADIEL